MFFIGRWVQSVSAGCYLGRTVAMDDDRQCVVQQVSGSDSAIFELQYDFVYKHHKHIQKLIVTKLSQSANDRTHYHLQVVVHAESNAAPSPRPLTYLAQMHARTFLPLRYSRQEAIL